jgi:hypothetical protein
MKSAETKDINKLGKSLKIVDKKNVIQKISKAFQDINFNMSCEIKYLGYRF